MTVCALLKTLMTNSTKATFEDRTATAHAIDLLTHYSFDLGNQTAPQLLDHWLADYSTGWIRWAVIEALYQGRYKAVSVEQILKLWQRRKQPCYHFSYEFERLVCHKFPRNLAQSARIATTAPPVAPSVEQATLPTLPALTSYEVEPFRPPAWDALAEQSQHNEELSATSTEGNVGEPPLEQETVAEAEIPLPSISAERNSVGIVQLQAGMEALINQATSHLNASTEAGTKLLSAPPELREALISEHHDALESDYSGRGNGSGIKDAASDNFQLGEDVQVGKTALVEDNHLPIHQFTPIPDKSDFHSKLKAVADQELNDLRS